MSMESIKKNEDENLDSLKKNESNIKNSVFIPVKFKNKNNENNCFISVVFHSLFHFTELKEYLINIEIKPETPKLIEEIVLILKNYHKINKDKEEIKEDLNPFNFRNELANHFKNEFQLNEQGDPIELLNYLLNCIHSFNVSNGKTIDNAEKECKNDICPIHKLFYINLYEISKCMECKSSNKLKYDNNYFIEFLNVNLIIDNIKKDFNIIKENLMSFSKGIKQNCEFCKKNTVEKYFKCESIGKYLIINLGWSKTKMEDLCYLYIMIGKQFKLKDLYAKCEDKNFYFMGMFLYWNNHYICLFYEKKLKYFIMYDDNLIKVFSSWKNLISKLIKSFYQPVALIYGDNEEYVSDLHFDLNETFYNQIINLSQNNDKNKEENGISSKRKIKENEWECEFCKKINHIDNDICDDCKKLNYNITFMIKSKYETLKEMNEKELSEEDKIFIQQYEKKKMEEEMTKKWSCSQCGCKTNLITNPICSVCNSKNNNLEIKTNDLNKNKDDLYDKDISVLEIKKFHKKKSNENNVNKNNNIKRKEIFNEKERIEKEKNEKERIELMKLEKEKKEKEKEKERIEQMKLEKEKKEKEKEKERIELMKLEKEKKEKERIEQMKIEKEKKEKEKKEKERIEQMKLEKEKSGDKKISYENKNEKEEKKIEENYGRIRKKRKLLPDYFENKKEEKKLEENSKIIKQLEDNHEKEIIDEDNILRNSIINFTIKKRKTNVEYKENKTKNNIRYDNSYEEEKNKKKEK